MHKITNKLNFIIFTILFLCSCSSTKKVTQTTSKQNSKTTNFPKAPKKIIPEGTGDNWRYLGKTSNGQIIIEIDENSINQTSNQQFQFKDRKTIKQVEQFNYQNFPKYKYNISIWLLNCADKNYKILKTSIFDSNGALIKDYTFSSTPTKVTKNSIIEKEYDYICKNKNRDLGY